MNSSYIFSSVTSYKKTAIWLELPALNTLEHFIKKRFLFSFHHN